MTRRLVITADDFGREPATTETIAALLADGCVSTTSLIAVAPGAEDAVRRAADLGVVPRLHVTLSADRGQPPWRALSGVSSITDPDGALADDPALTTSAGRGWVADAIREADAQLDWMHSRGLRPVAADSHAGTLYGLYGAGDILGAALQWCARNGLAFRLPRDPTLYFGAALPDLLARRHAQAIALADDLGVPLPQAIVTNRLSANDLGSYEGLRDRCLRLLSALPEGTSELFLHPSREEAAPGPAGIVRAWEARLLRDPKWLDALDAEGIEVVVS